MNYTDGPTDYLNVISSILEQGQKMGVFRKDLNSSIVKLVIFGALDEMALEWVLMKKKKYTMEDVASQICSLFIEGLRASPH